MYSFDKIKLIIWDMDETFWNGTITEGNVVIPEEHKQLILSLTDAGIVNSICSKNDIEPVKCVLEQENLWEYFVFPSINWEAKGNRVKQLIADMQLRSENVLFVDDNASNLGEVKYFCPEIMAELPTVIPQLINDASFAEKKDVSHKRLKQYKVLEEKHIQKNNYSSNEEFLFESGIKVDLGEDCIDQIDRIQDLVMRSNQLNFTKLRSSKEELIDLFNDKSFKCGYVSVSDKFGDYGITGFYAVKDNNLKHFVFSCRTLGMGIEQYIYNLLGRPNLAIVGEVVSDLSMQELPKWINVDSTSTNAKKLEVNNLEQHQVLIKGPCDLFQVFPYIANPELFDTEFTYVTDTGLTVETTGHTTHIVESHRLSKEQKERVISEVPFTDIGMYSDALFTNQYKVVIISILADANLGVYRRKETGERLAIMEYIHPLTDKESYEGIISGEYPHSGFDFTKDILDEFASKYEFLGRNTADDILDNLKYIRKNLASDCLLAIMLGGELYYEKNTFEAYKDRHIVHKEINAKIRKWAAEESNVKLIDVNKHLIDQSSFYDHFNHYTKPIYYKLSGEIVDIINSHIGMSIGKKSKLTMLKIRIKEMLAPLYYKLTGKGRKQK
ncbi:MAG: HAD-IIIC family phosphatase [Clostridia bacterium]|nr:HAD-IIIC family phosphatase [Clostridia bacterium]